MQRIHVGLIGDFDKGMYTHIALNESIEHCRRHLNFQINTTWVATDHIDNKIFSKKFDGFWITPGSPYKNDEAVYKVITWARENNVPLFGTCGGFQYMIVEYARNVLGLHDAGHEESDGEAKQLVISKMSCSLKGQEEEIMVTDKNSWLYQTLKSDNVIGRFNCSYGVNPAYQKVLNKTPFVFTAFSNKGEARAFELKDHRFFHGTLFQPPLDSTLQKPNVLLMDFFKKLV